MHKQLEEIRRHLRVKEVKRDSKRLVTLDEIAINPLKSREGKVLAEGFTLGEVPLVFPNKIGTHLRNSNFDRECWYPICGAVGIPNTTRFHDLRHTQASSTLSAGVDLKVIRKRLGHAKCETTANT